MDEQDAAQSHPFTYGVGDEQGYCVLAANPSMHKRNMHKI